MERGQWLVEETDDFMIVIPEIDARPHGIKVSETEYDASGTECDCSPKVMAGTADALYEKPIVIHSSFDDQDRVLQSMERFVPSSGNPMGHIARRSTH